MKNVLSKLRIKDTVTNEEFVSVVFEGDFESDRKCIDCPFLERNRCRFQSEHNKKVINVDNGEAFICSIAAHGIYRDDFPNIRIATYPEKHYNPLPKPLPTPSEEELAIISILL